LIFGQALQARSYTAPLSFPPVEADLRGRVIIVTGGSTGLGLACTKRLSELGATVHVLCRDVERGKANLQNVSGAVVHGVDVGLVKSVQAFAESIPGPIHGLVNNAGALLTKRVLNDEGVEAHVASHVLGTHALTKALAAKFADGASVVNVVSAGLYSARICMPAIENGFASLEKNGKIDGALAYAVCKRAQLELTKRWAAALPKCTVTAMHPGWAKSAGLDGLFELHPAYKSWSEDFRTPEDGADTMVWLAATPPPACTGKFFFDRAEAPEHKTLAGTESKSKEIKQLWEFCEAKTASLGRVDFAAASSAAATSAAATSADATSAAA
jgi:NAD(P)-dependent dehydrogenase (short-subunit alcohol dehydrogenase family)